ncbi:helix-turn-helix domain-containing protein [Rhizobium sp. P32RR-XVIII]|uniref:helix-turn-helix domain-containing protein n=1 Tax=Rhizobium sp. P32RR-XVIII TaxID=2726738 RepID=UPI003917E808
MGGPSRATLVRALQRICGIALLTYLAEVRFDAARRRLVDSADSIAQVAAEVGYQSEAGPEPCFPP